MIHVLSNTNIDSKYLFDKTRKIATEMVNQAMYVVLGNSECTTPFCGGVLRGLGYKFESESLILNMFIQTIHGFSICSECHHHTINVT